MEEVQQLPLSELSEGACARGRSPQLEQQPKFILPINSDAAGGINLPDGAVYHDGESCHIPEPRRYGREEGRTLRPPPFPEQTGRPRNRPEVRAAGPTGRP